VDIYVVIDDTSGSRGRGAPDMHPLKFVEYRFKEASECTIYSVLNYYCNSYHINNHVNYIVKGVSKFSAKLLN